MITKTSIRFFNNKAVRARWDQENKKWWYSASDVVGAITESGNARRFWNTIKSRHKELAMICKQIKLTAYDGKMYLSDVLDMEGIQTLLLTINGKNKIEFARWIKGLSNPIDEESRTRAYELFENGMLSAIEVGSVNGLLQIHSFLFEGLYSFAGKIRDKNILKGGFTFANCNYLESILKDIEEMSENTFKEIVEKYIEMNIAHPFMEGNGRATRIWLDLILKKNLKKVIDWSKIEKNDYLEAMKKSPFDSNQLENLLFNALTDEIDSREVFMKGIDYSYYYEEVE